MTKTSQYEQDFYKAHCAMATAIGELQKSVPMELIISVVLLQIRDALEDFRGIEEWEVIKSELIDIRDFFESNAEPYWSNEIDRDLVALQYDNRYG